jgi:hypothetical protein
VPQPELALPAQRHRAQPTAGASAAGAAARVTVTWTASNHEGVSGAARNEVELVAALESAASRTWTCPESFGSNWLDALCSAGCNEVLLTARVGSDSSAKHQVLELAELLTFTLAESQPLIRVLFLPSAPEPRRVRSHA